MTVSASPSASPTAAPTSSTQILLDRLLALRTERDAVLAESLLESGGDVADRATNVEATIRRQLLEERIAVLELEIDASRRREHTEGVVSIGDLVTIDLGEGPEQYLVGSVEQAASGIDTVTPGSPLGQAIIGAAVGSTVSYRPRSGLTMEAVILEAGLLLPQSA